MFNINKFVFKDKLYLKYHIVVYKCYNKIGL